MGEEVIHVDARVPDDPDEEAELAEAAARVFGEEHPLGIFIMKWLQRETQDDRRHDDEWFDV